MMSHSLEWRFTHPEAQPGFNLFDLLLLFPLSPNLIGKGHTLRLLKQRLTVPHSRYIDISHFRCQNYNSNLCTNMHQKIMFIIYLESIIYFVYEISTRIIYPIFWIVFNKLDRGNGFSGQWRAASAVSRDIQNSDNRPTSDADGSSSGSKRRMARTASVRGFLSCWERLRQRIADSALLRGMPSRQWNITQPESSFLSESMIK